MSARCDEALAEAGGLDDVAAVAVGGQQHGMVCLDEDGAVVRPALLWNDTRSAQAAADLVAELGGRRSWADAVGSVPVASFTVTKLRWLAEHEPDNAAATAAVCLPHDWLTWRLRAGSDRRRTWPTWSPTAATPAAPATGLRRHRGVPARPARNAGFGRADVALPRVLGAVRVGRAGRDGGQVLGPGRRRQRRRRARGWAPGRATWSSRSARPGWPARSARSRPPTRPAIVAGFAVATGEHLPLVCTLNAARVLDATARLLGVDHDRLAELALSAPAGRRRAGAGALPRGRADAEPARRHRRAARADAGDRAPRRTWPAPRSRACCAGSPTRVDALEEPASRCAGCSWSAAAPGRRRCRQIAPAVLGRPVVVPAPGEYVADGAARQAAWVLAGAAEPPVWEPAGTAVHEADPTPAVRERYAEVRELTAARL